MMMDQGYRKLKYRPRSTPSSHREIEHEVIIDLPDSKLKNYYQQSPKSIIFFFLN